MSSQASNAAPDASPTSLRDERVEQWFHLTNELRTFLDQKPKSHPLYEFALQTMRNGESLDYYRGVYDALVQTMNVIPSAKHAEMERAKQEVLRAQEAGDTQAAQSIDVENNELHALRVTAFAYERVVNDFLKLQIGLSMSRMLKRWPDKWQPRITDNDGSAKVASENSNEQ